MEDRIEGVDNEMSKVKKIRELSKNDICIIQKIDLLEKCSVITRMLEIFWVLQIESTNEVRDQWDKTP